MGNMLHNPDLDPEASNALRRMNRAQRRAHRYYTRRYAIDRTSPKKTNRRYVLQKMYQAMLAELED